MIKAEDLRIGDLVKVNKDCPFKEQFRETNGN